MKQKFIVFIPTLEGTYIVGKCIFKTFKTKNQEALIRMIIQAIEKCVHLSFAPSITRPHQDARDPLRDRDPPDRTLMTSLK